MKRRVSRVSGDRARRGDRAFSLLEMLVVVSVIAVLMAMLLPALSASRRLALNLKCLSNMQKGTFEFRMFADDFAARTVAGNSFQQPGRFFIEDFQESLYKIDEYWDGPLVPFVKMEASREIMMCPLAGRELIRRPSLQCSQLAVSPRENVSMAFNRRLHRDGFLPFQTVVTAKILNHPDVPLLMDVDGDACLSAGKESYYIAPPLPSVSDSYASGAYWHPSFRHDGKLNVAFVGGHVAASARPLQEPRWRWEYIPSY